MALISNKLETLFTQGCFVPIMVESAKPRLFYRRFLFVVNEILTLEKGMALHLNKIIFPLPKNALCQVCLSLAQWFLRDNLEMLSMHFQFLTITCLGKGFDILYRTKYHRYARLR